MRAREEDASTGKKKWGRNNREGGLYGRIGAVTVACAGAMPKSSADFQPSAPRK
jgi:hypothetical protein